MISTHVHMRKVLLCASLILSLFSTPSISAQFSAPAIQWDKTLGGNDEEGFTTIAHTSDGGSIVASYSMSELASGNKTENNVGGADIWVVKLDANGVIQWQNAIGGNDHDFPKSIKQTTDGGYIVGGGSQSHMSGDKTENNRGVGGYGNSDYWVVKLDANGIVQWDKTFGGSGDDMLEAMAQTADGGFILGGSSNSPISGEKSVGSTYEDYWVIKLNAAGTLEWEKTIGAAGTDYLSSIQQTADGGFIMGGYTYVANGNVPDPTIRYGEYDYYIVKTDALGTVQWKKTYGGSGSDVLHSTQQTPDGGYILGGYSGSTLSGVKTEVKLGVEGDFWVIKTDAAGTIQWQNTIGGNNMDYLQAMVQTADGGYVLGGYSSSTPSFDKTSANKGDTDFWVVKINGTGVIEWEKTVGTSGLDYIDNMAILTDGTLLLIGGSASNIDGDKTENSYGSNDMWVVKLGLPQPSITPSVFDQYYCLNTVVAPLTAVGQNLLWYTTASGGVGSTTAPTASTAVVGVTSYYVSQTVNNIESPRVEIKVTVYGLPNAAIVANSSTCAGVSVALHATGGVSYVWGHTGSTWANIYSTPSVTTTYTMTATDTNGCKAVASKTITVYPNFTATLTGNNSICRGSSTTLSVSGGSTYVWNTGQTTASISVAPTTTTTYYVTVTGGTCTKTLSKTVYVSYIGTVTITGLNTQYARNAAPVTLTGTPTGGVFKIDNVVAAVFNPSLLSNGYHNVTYTVTSGVCISAVTKTVRIVNGSSNLQSSATAQLAFNSAVEKNRIKLAWFNNTGDKNDYFIVQKMDDAGVFVNLEYVKPEADTKNQELNFFKTYDNNPSVGENTYRIHTVFTDGNFLDSELKTVNFKDLGAAQISPNPANDFININLENYIGKPIELSLFNSFGQLVKNQILEEVQTPVVNMDISTAQSGLYMMQIASKGKRDAVVKFVVNK